MMAILRIAAFLLGLLGFWILMMGVCPVTADMGAADPDAKQRALTALGATILAGTTYIRVRTRRSQAPPTKTHPPFPPGTAAQ